MTAIEMRRYEIGPRPAGLEQLPQGECFWNAGRTALNYGCKYVEGFVLVRGEAGAEVWVHHAWNVGPDGQAFDLTLPGWLSGIGYVGAEFSVLDVVSPNAGTPEPGTWGPVLSAEQVRTLWPHDAEFMDQAPEDMRLALSRPEHQPALTNGRAS